MKIDQRLRGIHIATFVFNALKKVADDKLYRFRFEEIDDRSLSQNDQSYVWYGVIAEYLGDRTALDARCESKLYCGVPILLSDDEDFRKKWYTLIKDRFTVEEKIELMEWFPVSSLMSKKQFTRYLERMQAYWARSGVVLEFQAADRSEYPEAQTA
jgi:hypothetical protein